MKNRLIAVVCAAGILFCGSTPVLADESGMTMAADILVVRPVCLVATILGGAVFVVGLPIAATSKSVKKAAKVLVSTPAKATFKRPLGDMDSLSEY
jgi:hypothetical protein